MRKQLVMDEASAILRAYQRAQFLPEPQREESSELLRNYLGIRNQMAEQTDLAGLAVLVAAAEENQDALWAQAQSQAEKPNAVLAGFMASIAELTDLQMKRVRAVVWNRIPSAILVTLYLMGFLALMGMGYNAGLAESRTIIPSVLLSLTFSVMIVLIVDLERPNQRLFEVSQGSMHEVARRIQVLEPEPLPPLTPERAPP